MTRPRSRGQRSSSSNTTGSAPPDSASWNEEISNGAILVTDGAAPLIENRDVKDGAYVGVARLGSGAIDRTCP